MLYIVSTPIGNLEDITLRALRILGEVDLILCEDTRIAKKLLNHYEIKTSVQSYHQHSSLQKIDYIIDLLQQGKNLALISDAGTPAVSDPGSMLVGKIRAELPEEKIVAVPGASALTATIALAGIPIQDFIFLGFLPHKKGRETLFQEISKSERAMIFYESTHRIIKTLQSLSTKTPDRKIILAREITKIYEETLIGTASELLQILASKPEKTRGEFVVIVTRK